MLTGYIFPAFVSEYKGDEPEVLRGFSDDFDKLLKHASGHLGIDLTSFDVHTNNFQDHELNTQYMSYIFGCTVSDILKQKKIFADYLAGYSMGIYAALYSGESVTFIGGLDLISKAFEIIKETLHHHKTGMGTIVGLEKKDVGNLIKNKAGIAIANTNGTYSFMISGIMRDINEVLELARLEGALHTSLMNVSCPYHTAFLNEASGKFREYILEKITVKDSIFKLVSGIDQKIITNRNEIITELASNLNHEINWMNTMEKMIGLKVTRFIECGAGISLYKIGKFIEGDFRIMPVGEAVKPVKSVD